jgi:hypothetical protein
MSANSQEEIPQHMKRSTREAARGLRGSTKKRYSAPLSDGTLSLRDGLETRNEAQTSGGKLHFSLSRTIRYPVTDMMRTIRMGE